MCLSVECGLLARKQAAQPVYVPPNPSAFIQLVAEADESFQKLLRMLADTGYAMTFGQDFIDELVKFHAEAHMIGQSEWDTQNQSLANAASTKVVRLGKTFINPRTRDYEFVPGEADFVAGFIQNLIDKDPRYFDEDGVIRLDQVLGRMRMYEGKLRGTQGEGVLDGGPLDTLWKWKLGGSEEHCEDCPFLASLVAVTKAEWYTTPGSCDTLCLFNCTCKLVAEKYGVETAPPILRVA